MTETLPPASGVRLTWPDAPATVHRWVAQVLGSPVVRADSQPGGFSPGVASRLLLADGRRAFVKACGAGVNPDTPRMHRAEARISAALPAHLPVPRLLAHYDDGDWVALLFEDVPGRHPAQPWQADELELVLATVVRLHAELTPCPLPPELAPPVAQAAAEDFSGWRRLAAAASPAPGLDAWTVRHLDRLAELEPGWVEATRGDTLLHLDLRADNMLLTPGGAVLVDWPWAARGAAFFDLVGMAPSLALSGGPDPERLWDRLPAGYRPEPEALTLAVLAIAGLFTESATRPAPPGLPTLRAFQDAQGRAARAWLRALTGWS